MVTIAADLSKEEAPAQTVKEAVEKLGGDVFFGTHPKSIFMREFEEEKIFSGLDVLVNSAGILMSGSVETLDIADYDKVRIESCVLEANFLRVILQYTAQCTVWYRQWKPTDCDSFSGDEH